MAIVFPTSPTEGQVYNISPGNSYVFRGGFWRKAPMKTALQKNYVVNPAMQISQQNVDVAGTTYGYYPADQYMTIFFGTTAVVSAGRVNVITPNGSPYRCRYTVTTADAVYDTGDIYAVGHYIEGYRAIDLMWGSAAAQAVVIRFGFKGPAGTYSISMRNGGAGGYRCYTKTFVISAGQANTDTEQIFSIPGDTLGTWNLGTGVYLVFFITLACGTGSQSIGNGVWQSGNSYGGPGVTNGVGVLNNVFEIFDVGFYLDPYKTGLPPSFIVPEHTDELRRCQRYWYRRYGTRGVVNAATTVSRAGAPHPVPMRTAPSAAIVGSPKIYDMTVTPVITGVSASTSNAFAFEYTLTCSAGGMTAGRPALQYWSAEADYIAMNARM